MTTEVHTALRPVTHAPGKFQEYYCWPAVISAITGVTAEAAGVVINRLRGIDKKRLTRGVDSYEEAAPALREFGWSPEMLRFEPVLTLEKWIEKRARPGCVYVVRVATHVVAVADGFLVDNFWTAPHTVERDRWRRSRVVAVWLMVPIPTVFTSPETK